MTSRVEVLLRTESCASTDHVDAEGATSALRVCRTTSPGRDRALGRLAWILSGLLTIALGLWRSGEPAMWGDELATWGMTRVGWGDMWRLLGERDVVLAPYYALMHVWSDLFGASDFALRIPSVLAMAGAAALVAALGTRLADARVGLLAGLLFAVLPATSRYAQEARPYAFATLAAVLATLFLVRALDDPGRGRFAAYAGAVALLGSAHLVALSLLGAHVLVVGRRRRHLLPRWVFAACMGGLPGFTLLLIGSGQARQITWISRADLPALLAHPERLFGVALLAALIVALAMLSLSLQHPAAVYTTWALFPTALIFIAGIATPLWTPRYLLFTTPAWVLLGATTLRQFSMRRGVVVLLLAAVISVPTQVMLRAPGGHGQNSREVATLLEAMARPGDGIVFASPDRGSPWIGRDLVHHYTPVAHRPRDILALGPPRAGGHLAAAECRDVTRCLGETSRVWVVRVGELADPLQGIGEDRREALRRYHVVEVWHPEGMTLALLGINQAQLRSP